MTLALECHFDLKILELGGKMATNSIADKFASGAFSEFNSPLAGQSTDPNQIENSTTKKVADVTAEEQAKKLEEKAIEEKSEQTEEAELDEAIEVVSDFLNITSRSVNFQLHDESEKTVIKVYDNDTKELIKQFPSEEVLEIAKRIVSLREDVGRKTGILLDEKV